MAIPWWYSGKNPPANAWDMGLIPAPGRFYMLRGNEACALQLLNPCTVESVLCNKRHHNEKPVNCNEE